MSDTEQFDDGDTELKAGVTDFERLGLVGDPNDRLLSLNVNLNGKINHIVVEPRERFRFEISEFLETYPQFQRNKAIYLSHIHKLNFIQHKSPKLYVLGHEFVQYMPPKNYAYIEDEMIDDIIHAEELSITALIKYARMWQSFVTEPSDHENPKSL
jgi:hypothetical protein